MPETQSLGFRGLGFKGLGLKSGGLVELADIGGRKIFQISCVERFRL